MKNWDAILIVMLALVTITLAAPVAFAAKTGGTVYSNAIAPETCGPPDSTFSNSCNACRNANAVDSCKPSIACDADGSCWGSSNSFFNKTFKISGDTQQSWSCSLTVATRGYELGSSSNNEVVDVSIDGSYVGRVSDLCNSKVCSTTVFKKKFNDVIIKGGSHQVRFTFPSGSVAVQSLAYSCESFPVCRNGLLEGTEQCDDGNTNNNDACKNDCTNNVCGDNTIYTGVEACELPNTSNNNYCNQSTQQCNGTQLGTRDANGACNSACGCVEDPFVYGCVKDQCGATCAVDSDCPVIPESCVGNRSVSSLEGACQTNTCGCIYSDPAPPACVPGKCGATCSTDEQCDDGNIWTTDSCSQTTCGCSNILIQACGNGVLEAGEECDDGNNNDSDGCSSVCKVEKCGDGIKQTSEQCDDGNTDNNDACKNDCTNNVCGDNTIYTGVEACELPNTSNNNYCNQSTESCSGKKLGTRDANGVCNSACGCVEDPFVYGCVKDQCGATCDNPNDFTVNETTCNFGCSTDSCNFGNSCSLSSFCTNDTYNYHGTCSPNGCSFQQQNCNALDYYDNYTTYCSGSEVRQHRLFHDFSCGVNGCSETVTLVNDTLIENCNSKDNTQFKHCGLEDWSCVDDGTPSCEVVNITKNDDPCQRTMFCSGDTRNFNGTCGYNFFCQWQTEECTGDGSYCAGDSVETRDYFCTPEACQYNVTPSTSCSTADGWYNFGNVDGNDDPTCENRNYFCQDNGLNDTCVFNITQSHDYDNLDGNYCADSESLSSRDYFCNSTGQAEFTESTGVDCGTEFWSGGGDTPSFGNDPACMYNDFFCVSNSNNSICQSNNTLTQDFDNNDTETCIGVYAGQRDYWCNLATCNDSNPDNGCQPGTTEYQLACSLACGAECEADNNCADSTCQQTYNDFCSGNKLSEYDSDKTLDSTTITNSTSNTCLGSCGCTNNSASCNAPPINTYCVEGLCGATCDNPNDFNVTGNTCNFGCNTDSCNFGNSCSLSNFCTNDTFNHQGTCSPNGCSFQQLDCNSKDYYENFTIYCSGSEQRQQRLFHDFSCGLNGCNETVKIVDDTLIEDCSGRNFTENDTVCQGSNIIFTETKHAFSCVIDSCQKINTTKKDNTIENCDLRDGSTVNQCGVQDWTCMDNGTPACEVVNTTKTTCQANFCDGDTRNFDGVCNDQFFCEYEMENCNQDGSYCIYDKVQARDYFCTPAACTFNITTTEKCSADGWYNFGNVDGNDDPACENRDYFCVDQNLTDHCEFNITETHDYDNLDGTYCANVESTENRDYYCNQFGQAIFTSSNQMDCGNETWTGGGDTAGFGNDPSCDYTDYFCVDRGPNSFCNSTITNAEDFDTFDISNVCIDEELGRIDYWCNLQTCDSQNPINGCDPGTTEYPEACAQICGATCDNPNDFIVNGTTCSFGCNLESCGFNNQCSLGSFCTNETYNFQGTCNPNGCSFQQQDCNALDFYENFTTYCSGSEIRQHRIFHDFSCGLNGCNETTRFVNDTSVENCDANDNSTINQCGVEDWTCSLVGNTAACAVVNTTQDDTKCQGNFCNGDTRNFNGVCGDNFFCEYDAENCNVNDGSYCAGDGTELRDYFCTPSSCVYNVTQSTACNTDRWYNFGNVQGNDDPTCENRDYFCEDRGLNDTCTFNITQTNDYDNLDGNYCADSESTEIRDYFCNDDGSATFASSSHVDCGNETWTGGGDTPGIGDDPACSYTDYFCVSNSNNSSCQSNITTTQDFDSQDVTNVCIGTTLGETDYWCNLQTCDSQNPQNGCQPGTTNYTIACSETCGAACDNPNDFTVNGTTCNFGCSTDSCNFGQQCSLANFCTNDTFNYQGTCSANGCSFQQQNCNDLDYYENITTFCSGSELRQHRLFHDFSCGLNGCNETVKIVDEILIENCDSKDGSNVNQCGVQDWSCVDDGTPSCEVVNTTKTACQGNFCNGDERNYNGQCNDQFFCEYATENCNQDGTYCAGDSTETRDYFCSPSACQFNVTQTTTCGPDGWYNFGNIEGFDDPTCENRDYFCEDRELNDTCTFNVTQSKDFDYLDSSTCHGDSIADVDFFCTSQGTPNYTLVIASCGNDFYEYACPFGTSQGDDTGRRFHNSTCQDNACTEIVGDWEVDEICTDKEACFWDGQGNDDQNYFCKEITNCTDADNDGHDAISDLCPTGDDCNDANPNINPGAQELCNYMDDNCNNLTDEGFDVGSICAEGTGACQDTGVKICLDDGTSTFCDANPGQPTNETCNNIDDNCNGQVDENNVCAVNNPPEIHVDLTPDNPVDSEDIVCYGTAFDPENDPLTVTFRFTGDYTANGTTTKVNGFWTATVPAAETFVGDRITCIMTVTDGFGNDTDFDSIIVGSAETCVDNDNDGHFTISLTCPAGDDCNDNNHSIHPGAAEVCNYADDNCNNLTDEVFDVGSLCTAGIGACQSTGVKVCSADGFNTVCDATPKQPTAEICDELDNNCNGQVDENNICPSNNPPEIHVDLTPDNPVDSDDLLCIGTTSDPDNNTLTVTYVFTNGYSASGTATQISTNVWRADVPASETSVNEIITCTMTVTDGLNNNTDFDSVIIGNTTQNCTDSDNDGFNITSQFCDNGNDCDDNNPNVHPGAAELCNNVDDNCNEQIDEGFNKGEACFAGTGECRTNGTFVCTQDGSSTTCNAVPDAPSQEICDEKDNNCNGQVDENNVCVVDQCVDNDEDGFDAISDVCPTGNDCDDNNPDVHPGATETCNYIDDNCNGQVDETFDVGSSCAEGTGVCEAVGIKICLNDGSGTVCNAVPGAPSEEVCTDQLDNNCNGLTDEQDPVCEPSACIPFQLVSNFKNGSSFNDAVFTTPGEDVSVKFDVSTSRLILNAMVDMSGLPLFAPESSNIDMVIITDNSGTMSEGCAEENMTCKIDYAKNADKQLVDSILMSSTSKVGLVNFKKNVTSFMPLTSDKTALFSQIDTYTASGTTCISCGLDRGTEIASPSTKKKVMILISDGEANRCLSGSCTTTTAKNEAVTEAEQALSAGIVIHTIIITDTQMDPTTMQRIAEAGGGNYYTASSANLSAVLQDIFESEIVSHPENVESDIGNDGDVQFFHAGTFTTRETINFTQELKQLLSACTPVNSTCIIDISTLSDAVGIIRYDNLNITACGFAVNPVCSSDLDCGQGTASEWSSYVCDWENVCDTDAICTRQRSVVNHMCNNPGLDVSFCSTEDFTERKSIQSERELGEACTPHVLISEVFYDTPGADSDEEWIELYNPTNAVVDISTYTINDGSSSYQVPQGTSIPASRILIIARDSAGFEALYGFDPDVSGLTLNLNNIGGDHLTLKNGNVDIDMVAWEGGFNNAFPSWLLNANTNLSIKRVSSVDTDTPSDWTVDTPTPGAVFTLPAPPTNIQATASNDNIILTWTASPDAQYYKVYASDFVNGPFEYAANTTGTTWTDSAAALSKQKYYIVRSVAEGVEEANMNKVGKFDYTFTKKQGSTGKNWISLPLASLITKASELSAALGPNVDTISRWNSQLQQSEGWINVWGGVGTDFAVKRGEFYEVHVKETMNWTLTGSVPTTENNIEFNFVSGTGRNWIGLIINTVLVRASDLFDSIGNAAAMIRRWDPASQTYNVYKPSGGSNFTVKPGEGYEVHVLSNVTWTPV